MAWDLWGAGRHLPLLACLTAPQAMFDPSWSVFQYHGCTFLADHDRGRIGVAGNDAGHDRGICDAEPGDAVYPQAWVHHGVRPMAHAAGPDGMEIRHAALAGRATRRASLALSPHAWQVGQGGFARVFRGGGLRSMPQSDQVAIKKGPRVDSLRDLQARHWV